VQVRRHKQISRSALVKLALTREIETRTVVDAVLAIASEPTSNLKFVFLASQHQRPIDCTVVAGSLITNSIQHHKPTTWPPPTPRSSMRNHIHHNAPNPQADQIAENSWASLAASSRTSHTHPNTPNPRPQLTNEPANTSSPSSKPTNSPRAPSRSSRRPCATTLRS
jgi:hypothetical protein